MSRLLISDDRKSIIMLITGGGQDISAGGKPMTFLTAIKGTALENLPRLGAEEILRTIAIFRYINPTANVRFAAGRKFLPDKGASAFLHGASASITGNMLTTSSNNIQEDMKLLAELGLTNKPL